MHPDDYDPPDDYEPEPLSEDEIERLEAEEAERGLEVDYWRMAAPTRGPRC